jgi:predicted alpha/beta superfamily hydrolase
MKKTGESNKMKNCFKTTIPGIIFFVISAFSSLPAQNNGDPVVAGKYVKVFSHVLDEERTLLVSLPEGYENSAQSYPVLFVLDGDAGSLIDAIAAARISANGYSPEMIIVAIANTKRNRDMVPGSDTAPKFLRFITEELFPVIAKECRTDNRRVLYGASNAGLFVVFSFLENPENFTGYIASNPTICWRQEFMIGKARELLAKKVGFNKFLYIIYGDKDFKEVPDALAVFLPLLEELKAKGLRLQTKYLPEEGHVPLGSLQFGLLAMYDGYAYPEEKRKTAGLDSLKAYFDNYSTKVGYSVKPPLPAISRLGQWFLFEKKNFKESIAVFEYALQHYPDDFACTVMLAVGYYNDHSIDLARKYYFKTKEIMNKTKDEEPPFAEWKEMKAKFE